MLKEIQKIKNILPRRLDISHSNTYIYGAPRSGKTYLAISFASKIQHCFYLNLDILHSTHAITQAKQSINALHAQSVIIFDNFYQAFLDDMNLSIPYVCIGDITHYIHGYHKVKLHGLSFEEYLSFDTKKLNIETLFSNFIRDGNSPEILFLPDFKKHERKWEIMQIALKLDFEIFYHILALQSLKVSIHGIYQFLKQKVKISKDRVYPLIHKLQSNSIIYLCYHIHEYAIKTPNAKYKLYFYDFSLSEFSDSRNFLRMYENMVFLELIAMKYEVFYSDLCDFIDIQKRIIFLCMPFASLESIQEKIALIRLNEPDFSDFTIIVISMNLDYECDSKLRIVEFINLSLYL